MRQAAAAVGAAAIGMFLWAGSVGDVSAAASTPIHEFAITPSTTQAGGHPNIVTKFVLGGRYSEPKAPGCDCNDARDTFIHSATGVIANPHATPQCTDADFTDLLFYESATECPVDTQVGVANINAIHGDFHLTEIPVYNLEPHPTEAGLLGFFVPFIAGPIYVAVNARTQSDYGLDLTTENITHLVPLEEFELTLWGVPASPSNDFQRYPYEWSPEVFENPAGEQPPTRSNAPEEPFLSNPTTCGVPLTTSLEVVSYDRGTSNAEDSYPATTGCDQLSFNPSLSAEPTTSQTDSATGLEVNLSVPQEVSPTVPSPSELRANTVTLPAGLSINPSAADGKTYCSDSEARLGTQEEAECPEYSKVGTVSILSSALPAAIPGYIYIGEPQGSNRYRIILTANGFNTHVKLVGNVEPNVETGQLTVSFANLPQTSFSDFDLHFFGSERGLLATPTRCGTYSVESSFTPWDTALQTQSSTQLFNLQSGPDGSSCPVASRPFKPSFRAASEKSEAGAHSAVSIEIGRNDGEQNLSALTITMPPGVSATLAGVPYCSDSALSEAQALGHSGLGEDSDPSCPAASQIGTAIAGAGAGTNPVYLAGKVYLAGPYKGAPLSLAVITPAVSGPYDLGNVVVRAALHVDPTTAQITGISDPLPQILQGIPLRLREIRINLSRQGFTLNPTNCAAFLITARVEGDEGAMASPGQHFQVANCRNLRFCAKARHEAGRFDQSRWYPRAHCDRYSQAGRSKHRFYRGHPAFFGAAR